MKKRTLPPHPNLPDWKPFVYTPEQKTETPKTTKTVPKILSPRMARKITAAYRCAACWSPLEVFLHVSGEYAGLYSVECEYCGSDVPGFVTRTYIAYRILENEEEYRQARLAMQNAFPFLFPEGISTKSFNQAMHELGY